MLIYELDIYAVVELLGSQWLHLRSGPGILSLSGGRSPQDSELSVPYSPEPARTVPPPLHRWERGEPICSPLFSCVFYGKCDANHQLNLIIQRLGFTLPAVCTQAKEEKEQIDALLYYP